MICFSESSEAEGEFGMILIEGLDEGGCWRIPYIRVLNGTGKVFKFLKNKEAEYVNNNQHQKGLSLI